MIPLFFVLVRRCSIIMIPPVYWSPESVSGSASESSDISRSSWSLQQAFNYVAGGRRERTHSGLHPRIRSYIYLTLANRTFIFWLDRSFAYIETLSGNIAEDMVKPSYLPFKFAFCFKFSLALNCSSVILRRINLGSVCRAYSALYAATALAPGGVNFPL